MIEVKWQFGTPRSICKGPRPRDPHPQTMAAITRDHLILVMTKMEVQSALPTSPEAPLWRLLRKKKAKKSLPVHGSADLRGLLIVLPSVPSADMPRSGSSRRGRRSTFCGPRPYMLLSSDFCHIATGTLYVDEPEKSRLVPVRHTDLRLLQIRPGAWLPSTQKVPQSNFGLRPKQHASAQTQACVIATCR